MWHYGQNVRTFCSLVKSLFNLKGTKVLRHNLKVSHLELIASDLEEWFGIGSSIGRLV